jgi:hypothetical protein
MKISAIAYQIDKFANNKNGKLSDHNKYALGFVANNYNDVIYDPDITWDPDFYSSESGNTVLYTGRYGSHYQKDLTVVLLEEGKDRYKVQSSNPISNGSLNTDDGVIKYKWDESVAYIDKTYVTVLNGAEVYRPEPELEHDQMALAFDMEITDGVLMIDGVGLLTNFNMTDLDKASHTLYVYDLSDDGAVKEIECESVDSGGYSINDGYDYKYAGFKASVALNELEEGSYILRMESGYNGVKDGQNLLRSYNDEKAYLSFEDDDHYYTVKLNDFYGYRIEVDVTDKLVDVVSISKTSARSSLITLDDVTYEEEGDKVYAVFEGLGMIYYLNYDLDTDMHQLYLVNPDKVIKVETKSQACSFDYSSFYESSYNMDRICYTAKADLSELDGDYRLLMEISNGGYRDIAEITNAYEYEHNTYSSDPVRTEFITDKVRDRLIFSVIHSEE